MKIIALFHLLAISVGATILLLLCRIAYSGNFTYLFFVWNIFLAAAALGLSTLLIRAKKKLLKWFLFVSWLLFFPNALYIVTDLLHLKDRPPVPLWFDMIFIYSAAANGLIMAYVSLRQAEQFLTSKFNRYKTNMIVSGCLVLGSFGVYLGRFLRLNSWDVFINPLDVTYDIIQHIMNPFQHPRAWGMTLLLAFFFSIFFFTLKKIPGLLKPGT